MNGWGPEWQPLQFHTMMLVSDLIIFHECVHVPGAAIVEISLGVRCRGTDSNDEVVYVKRTCVSINSLSEGGLPLSICTW